MIKHSWRGAPQHRTSGSYIAKIAGNLMQRLYPDKGARFCLNESLNGRLMVPGGGVEPPRY